MSDKRYAIWVSVSGGVTGPRSAWLKGKGGKVQTFTSMTEAITIAEAYKREMNNPYATATFNAQVMELSHE